MSACRLPRPRRHRRLRRTGRAVTGMSQRGRWHRRVRDVMTTSVVTVDRITPYKEIAYLMAEHKVSALPVLIMGRHVAGVVSEADLLAVEEKHAAQARIGRRGPPAPAHGQQALGPHGRRTDDLTSRHDPPGRDDPGRGKADELAPHQATAGSRSSRHADRDRQPPRPAQRLPPPGRGHRRGRSRRIHRDRVRRAGECDHRCEGGRGDADGPARRSRTSRT